MITLTLFHLLPCALHFDIWMSGVWPGHFSMPLCNALRLSWIVSLPCSRLQGPFAMLLCFCATCWRDPLCSQLLHLGLKAL